MKRDDIIIVEELVVDSKKKLTALTDSLNILDLTEDQSKLFQATLNIMEAKVNGIIEADSKKEMKKHLNLKKLLRDKR